MRREREAAPGIRRSEIGRWRRRGRTALQVLRGIVVTVGVGVAAAAAAIELGLWAPEPTALLPAVVIVAVGGGLDAFRSLIQSERATADAVRQRDLDLAIQAAIVEVAAETGLDATRIGCGVWGIYEPPWWMLRRGPCLIRIRRFRMTNDPAESDRAWTKGVGAIGRCWSEAKFDFHDWRPMRNRLKGKDRLSNDDWKAISEKERYGFARDDFLAAVRKYEGVAATPIMSQEEEMIGVVSMDFPTLSTADGQQPRVDSARTREIMARAAKSVQDLVKVTIL